MTRSRKKAPAAVPRARNTHSRQRQRLIDACISALHLYGPSRTTVEKVVSIAKMSPGIVRFYFASKAAMLVASLQFLAAEFEQQLMLPVARLKARPVEALELLVELYIDPEIATARKVSVWYSFWGEASSRQEYYDICGQKDESFAVLVRELVERLIVSTGQTHLDADGVALGLIGVLEILWQDFAFQDEADIDRPAAKRRAMAYLRSVFPGQFGEAAVARSSGAPAFKSWVFDNARLAALERSNIFQQSWQLVGLRTQLQNPGDYLASELAVERALLVLDETGGVRALRNSCPAAPHALVPTGCGRLAFIDCPVHGLRFDLTGRRLDAHGGNLTALELLAHAQLLLVRARAAPRGTANALQWQDLVLPEGTYPLEESDRPIAADWKVVAETLLAGAGELQAGCSRRALAALVGDMDVRRRVYLPPNHWLEIAADGFSVLQLLPTAPGRSVLRRHRFSRLTPPRRARTARYLSERVAALGRPAALALAESIQRGALTFGYQAAAPAAPAVEALRRELILLLPLLAHDRPPGDS